MGETAVDLRQVRQKVLAYLRDKRVRVISARTVAGGSRPDEVVAHVRGHRAVYGVRGIAGTWGCTCGDCPAASVVVDQCAHVAAVALVTGWPSAAAPLTTQTPPE